MSNIFELHSNTQHASGLNTPNLAFGYLWVCLGRLSRRSDPNAVEMKDGAKRVFAPWKSVR